MSLPSLSIVCSTQNQPAPYAYQQNFEISPKGDHIEASLEMVYTGRESLSEEEIYDEGFTNEDDFSWQGQLPIAWKEELDRVYSKTTFRKKPDKETPLTISLNSDQGESQYPSEYDMWEYVIQELAQAIFEAGGRELPLKVEVMTITKAATHQRAINGSFANRSASVTSDTFDNKIDWLKLKSILKTVFLPDYLPELATDKTPRKRGIYISPEAGMWYKLGHAILEPSKKSKALPRLEQLVEELISL
ncbi:MAG: hypothetical protein AAGC88_13055 [Bacteroidota bacterium]